METKDLILLMLIPIILVSLVFYVDKSPAIIGAVTHEPKKESNILGTYSVNPSFKTKIEYSLNDYNKIKESLDFIIKCSEEGKDIKTCIDEVNIKDTSLKWELGCEKGAEKVLYDFAEFLQDCFDSDDTNCLCRKDMRPSDNELKKYELSNKRFKIELIQDKDFKKITIKMKEPDIGLSYDVKISSKSKSTWYPTTIDLAYVENKIVLIFQNVIGDILMKQDTYYYALPPDKKEIIIYKNMANNIDSVDFVKEENDNVKYPNDKIITDSNNNPIEINNVPNCQIKPKNIYKFCVTQNKYKFMVYDKLDNQVKERPLTIKFAAYIHPKTE